MDLSGKTAIVTGASSGIGAEIARRFTDAGAKVTLTARREAKLTALRDEIIEAGGGAIVVPGDITKEETAQQVVDQTLEAFGGIDILVNNAGYGPPGSLLETDTEMWDATVDSCLKSVYLMTRAVLPTLLEAGGGRVVQVSSVAGKNGYANRTAYCAAKWGVQGFSEALRKEIEGSGVRVHTVNPAAVATEWWGKTNDAQAEQVMEQMIQPEEIAEAIVWLLRQPERLQIDEVVVQTYRSPWEGEQ